MLLAISMLILLEKCEHTLGAKHWWINCGEGWMQSPEAECHQDQRDSDQLQDEGEHFTATVKERIRRRWRITGGQHQQQAGLETQHHSCL